LVLNRHKYLKTRRRPSAISVQRDSRDYFLVSWASSGKFLYVPVEAANLTSPGRSLAVPLGPGETLPALPADGIRPEAKADEVPGALSVDREQLVGGQDPAHYAYVNTTVHRNLYRVSLP
jgi:hypothetical protein